MLSSQFSHATYRTPLSFTSRNYTSLLRFSSFLKVDNQLRFSPLMITNITVELQATLSTHTQSWEDNVVFDHIPASLMYVCCGSDKFSDGQLVPYGNIELNPFSSVFNYGQGIIEGLKAYKKEDDSGILLFRPEVNALRMIVGADRLCMPAPTISQFVEAVKLMVLANRQWIPPQNKGFLYIRPLLIGTGAVLSLMPSPEFIFLIYATLASNYSESKAEPIDLVVEDEIHRAVRGGVGSLKAIGNYAMVTKAQVAAKENDFHEVLYLDAVYNKYLEGISTANIFLVKDKTICTPALRGTVVPGITWESIIDIARNQGFQVEQRLVSVEELFRAEEVFCTGNSVGLLPVGSITYLGKRLSYKGGGLGTVPQQLSSALTDIQKGLSEDEMGWTTVLKREEK